MLLQYALKEIRRRKLRSAGNIIGYAIAIAFLIVAVTFAQGYNLVATGVLNGIGTHFAVYVPASATCPCQLGEVGPYFKGTYTPTFNASIVETIKQNHGVADAAPVLAFRLENLTICGIEVNSLATAANVVSPDEVVKGSYLKADDVGSVMVDSAFAEVTGIQIGKNITAFNRNFAVVGVVNPNLHSKPVGTANIYASLSVVQEIARYYGELYSFSVGDINVIAVEISTQGNSESINSAEQSALHTLESYAGKAGALVGYQCGYTARKVVSITEDSAWAIALVLILSATLYSLKSQLSSVLERTKDIGVLKSLGWTDSDITKQLFLESLIQGLSGTFIGLAIAVLAIFAVSNLGLVSPQNLILSISPVVAIIGVAVSIAAGTIASVIPAWRASRLSPADALRRF
jgi:putative ABC transport system permease protein